jgi:hypothetical protein
MTDTLDQRETKAFLQIMEAMKVLEQQLADAHKRIAELEQLLKNK